MQAAPALLLALPLAALAAGVPAGPAAQPALQGRVIQVLGGDTLLFRADGQGATTTVKLRDIDAPEPCQPWGAEARAALADVALNKPATLRGGGRDAQGKPLGQVWVDGELDLGPHLVEEGHAWSIRTRWDQGPLVKQERLAQTLRRGLHATPGAVMPRDFRQAHGPCVAGETAPVATPSTSTPTPAATGSATGARVGSAAPAALRCDGRTRCTQMRSCDEAKYFLAHCPGVQMDGDGNGVPCERQWCGSGANSDNGSNANNGGARTRRR